MHLLSLVLKSFNKVAVAARRILLDASGAALVKRLTKV
jgi:hypothetical protein